jgi:branched-chain amino acid transport system substrate-binding protein
MVRRIFAALAALVVAGPALAAAPRDYFKVGVVTELSGDLATGGNVTKRGYDLWAQAVNESGGLSVGGKRYPVKLVYADAQSNPAQGAAAAERLLTQEEVDFILGPSPRASPSLVAGGGEYKVPMIAGWLESMIGGRSSPTPSGPSAHQLHGRGGSTLAALSPRPRPCRLRLERHVLRPRRRSRPPRSRQASDPQVRIVPAAGTHATHVGREGDARTSLPSAATTRSSSSS